MKKQNILFMIADDHRFDGIGSFGNPEVRTPELDALAACGVAFHRTHIMGGLTGGLCAPCRAAVHTGVNVFRTSRTSTLEDNTGLRTIDPDLATMPRTLKEAGYHTYAIGKWHNDTESFTNGFCGGAKIFFGGMCDHHQVPVYDFDPSGEYPPEKRYIGESFSTELFCDQAVEFLKEYNDAEPYYLYIAFTSPHDPRTPPGEYADMYKPRDILLPDNYMPEHPFDNGELSNRDERLAPWPRTSDVIRTHIADYYGMISHMDAQIGRVLQALKERDDADNTIIVYTADHGIALGRHGLMGKQNLYEHSIRVPLIITGPGLLQDEHKDALVYSSDIFPTLCELTGVPIPDTVEQTSLVPLMRGESMSVRDSVFAVYKDVQRMACDGEWKLIRYYRSTGSNKGTDRIQLFHLEEDPSEWNDVSNEPGNQVHIARLSVRLAEWQRKVNDPWAGCQVWPIT